MWQPKAFWYKHPAPYICHYCQRIHKCLNRAEQKNTQKKCSPKWLNNIENKIAALRKNIGQLTTLINCQTTGNFTNYEKETKKKIDQKYGNAKVTILNFNLALLKKELSQLWQNLNVIRKNRKDKSPTTNSVPTQNQSTDTSRIIHNFNQSTSKTWSWRFLESYLDNWDKFQQKGKVA